MATVVSTAPPNGAAVESQPRRGKSAADLWAGMPIEVIVGSGEFGSGKTLFGLTIDPGERTLVYDNEGSSTIYQPSIGFHRVDMAAELQQAKPGGYTDVDRYFWWVSDAVNRGKSGNYSVLMVDPFSEIEAGLSQYVAQNPGSFGYTDAQFKKSSGLYWATVKSELKRALDRLRVLYGTIYLVVHMRDEWKGSSPTGKREPKGKETLRELASLFLIFDRSPDEQGNCPTVPAAIVSKTRLSHTKIDPASGEVEIVPILPPRLPKATPTAIRGYIGKPPNYKKLKPEERVAERPMTEAERLALELQISENQRAANEAQVTYIERMQAAAERQAAAQAATPQPPDQAGQAAVSRAEKTAAAAAPALPAQLEEIAGLVKRLGWDGKRATAFVRSVIGDISSLKAMTAQQANEVLAELHSAYTRQEGGETTARLQTDDPMAGDPTAYRGPVSMPNPAADAAAIEAIGDRLDQRQSPTEEAPDTVPFAPSQAEPSAPEPAPTSGKLPMSQCDGSITEDQRQTIMRLVGRKEGEGELPGVMSRDDLLGWLNRRGVNSLRGLSESDAGAFILLLPIVARIKQLAVSAGWPEEKQRSYLERQGVPTLFDLTAAQASAIRDKLASSAKAFDGGGVPGN